MRQFLLPRGDTQKGANQRPQPTACPWAPGLCNPEDVITPQLGHLMTHRLPPSASKEKAPKDCPS